MIDTSTWKEFQVKDIFNVTNGKGLTIEEIKENSGDIPCIQGGASNNGSIGLIDEAYCNKQKYIIIDPPCLTVARVGTAGYVNFQGEKCAIGDKCKALTLKSNSKSIKVYLFIQAVLQKLSYKYSYGRGLSTDIYMNDIIELPATQSGEPDWQYMEDFMGGATLRAYHNFSQVFAHAFGNGEVGRV